MHLSAPLILLLELAAILGLSRVMGALALRVRQPRVVGEMLAGIMLGPSLLGLLAPQLSAALFPAASVNLLNALAQIGVILFLFVVGLELDPKLIRDRGHAAVVISHVSIIAPFLLGAALTLLLYPLVFNDTPHMRFTPVALFMGAAMSITAFPVLARILTERELHKTKVGAITITCAAVDDVTAWCMLAFVVAIGRAEGLVPGLVTAGLSACYVLLMFLVVRPFLRRLEVVYQQSRGAGGSQAHGVLALVLLLTLASAAVTELIGIHALFGAFLMGAMMPKGTDFVRFVTGKIEDFVVIFLLPIFFAFAGLKTQIGLLADPYLLGLTLLIILTACLGKFGGSALAARACGLDWRESSAIGILMNTRGLMELVILTIGLQLGVITDAVYAMMVLMALVTTAMTTPILHWVYPPRLFEASPVDERTAEAEFGVLVPLSRPESGPGLARVVAALCPRDSRAKLYALSLRRPAVTETLGDLGSIGALTLPSGLSEAVTAPAGAPAAELQALQPLLAEAERLRVPAEAMAFASRDVPSDIARVARAKRADLIVMGFHKPLIGQAILGGSVHDQFALDLAGRMAACPGLSVTVLHVVPPGQKDQAGRGSLPGKSLPESVEVWVVEEDEPVDAVLRQSRDFDLLLMGLGEEWGLSSQLFGLREQRIAREWRRSLLLVRKYVPLAGLSAGGGDTEQGDHTVSLSPVLGGEGAPQSDRR